MNASFALARVAVLSMRPVQWTKNLLVFLPLAFSVNEHWTFDKPSLLAELVLRATAGTALFCVMAGAVYIVNDILDRDGDRAHPRKRKRPIASGALPVATAQVMAVALLGLSLAGSFLLDLGFGIAGAGFVLMNLAYSSYLKRLIVLDVMLVAAGYLLRAVAGALVIDVSASAWLYSTIGMGALFIALGKRYSELRAAGEGAASQRAVLGQYSKEYLGQLVGITSTATLVAYSLYTFTASNVPENHTMMLTVPFVVFGLFRYLHLVNQTYDAESPELVIIKDVPLALDVLLWAITAVVILAVNR